MALQKIHEFSIPAASGQHRRPVPVDADIFAVFDHVGRDLKFAATIDVSGHGTPLGALETRVFVVAKAGDILPSSDFPKDQWTRPLYLGTVVNATGAYHVWERRELSSSEAVTRGVEELMSEGGDV